ncbi:putative 3-ketosteroid-9-alpha-hydroxylase reductase subunit [Nocardia nova SH22a]|uniref:Putative 3-ketosteroid-9-alpha-hydroxylase reductase subunit n=1 Tax=Nocardia nova SH22a TaxID=1415166 RepID=W5TH35_9NOCA|nr:ferredoxin--NADP reductase [Nocardia nova]AHH18464.1 putative 3-ketosteroid-9-alpha-hydroxylase reductase subunit [Nocardia nova SH22a]
MTSEHAGSGAGRNSHVHSLRIVEVIRETGDATSIVLEVPEALVSKFKYHPGQFLTVRVPSERTGSVARCYSLSSSPHLDDDLVVTVKRTAGGYASNWLCDNAEVGMPLTVLTPSGVFVPKSADVDLLLIAAGSGITPMMSIAKSTLIGGSGTVYLFYANRDEESVIFGSELDEIMGEFPDRLNVEHWLERERGLPTADDLIDSLGAYSSYDTFVCGPAPFMDVARKALSTIGVPDARVHLETYRSLTGDPFADIVVSEPVDGEAPATATVEIDGQTVRVAWPRNAKLLDVLLNAGYDAPFSCREGACSACACTVRSGEVKMLRNDTLVDADLRLGLTLACQALPVTDSVDIAFDQ